MCLISLIKFLVKIIIPLAFIGAIIYFIYR